MERQERVAIITGAGRGIGRAAAVELVRCGYEVVVAARTREQLEETIRLAGRGVAVATDVTVPEEVERLVAGAIESFGRVDAVVHCAGLAPAISIDLMSIEQWHEVLNANLSSAFYLSRAVWPIFRQQQGGVIVHVSSMAARDPLPGFGAYGAAKAGLNLFSLALAREGQTIGVRVHTIAPGAVETEMFRALRTPDQWPREKTLEPAEVGRVIAGCVCGDLRYTSGEIIFLSKTL